MTTQNKIIDLTHLGLLKITGPDAKKFLQGQLTCNLDELKTFEFLMGAHCNPQGRIISFFRLFLHQESYFLQMPRELIPLANKALQKYAIFFKVKLDPINDDLRQVGYIDMNNENTSSLFANEHITVLPMSGDPLRYQFIGEANAIQTLQNELITHAHLSDHHVWKSIDMQQHIPDIYPETSEKFLPHDLDLPKLNAVSFNKGCFTGQEIIARMQYRGKLKNHFYHAKVSTPEPITRGADIYVNGNTAGTIVDIYQIDDQHFELLIIAQENDVNNNQLTLDENKKYFLHF